MSSAIHAGLFFLVNTVFDIYLFILSLRLVLVFVGSNYFDPMTQFVIKLTQFIVNPVRRVIPNIGRFESASIVIILVLSIIKFFLLSIIGVGMPNIFGLILLSFADLLKFIIQIFFYAILLQVILTWIQPYSPINRVLNLITSPIMQPLRRYIPPVGGFDITPIPALIILQLCLILIVNPLMEFGWGIVKGIAIG
jgi:YggT family protein